jgi:26S proteasome regulatory subunit N12
MFCRSKLGVSPHKFEILGANLLCLLTEGRLAEFHTELELILSPPEKAKEIMENAFVKRAVDLSQALEEGRYTKVHCVLW